MLNVESIHTYYGDNHIHRGISLAVGKSEVVALLGRNGAGKTTAIRSVMGLTPPRAGAITFLGHAIHRLPPYRIARLGIGLVPQGGRVFTDLTVLENLRIASRRNRDGWTIDRVFELFPRLKERASLRGHSLSGGEQQMLAIARALVSNPVLLLMDEPSQGLGPAIIRELGETIGKLKHAGLSILLVEQNYSLALSHADRVYVLNRGQIVFQGAPAELDADAEVKRRFLGVYGGTRLPASQHA